MEPHAQGLIKRLIIEGMCEGCPLQHEQGALSEPLSARVYGEGNFHSPVVFVGRNPGDTEVELGRPFVGPAGERLDGVFKNLGIDRSKCWVTNTVKCWTEHNVEPPIAAADHCWKLLRAELIGMRIIIALGQFAFDRLMANITKQPFDKRWKPPIIVHMIHPSAALRRGLFEAKLRSDTRKLKKLLIDEGVMDEIKGE